MNILTLLKNAFGDKTVQVASIFILGVVVAVSAPQYFATKSALAASMQQLHKQMIVGDLIQERQWLYSDIDRLTEKKIRILQGCNSNPDVSTREVLTQIERDIHDKRSRINQINMELNDFRKSNY